MALAENWYLRTQRCAIASICCMLIVGIRHTSYWDPEGNGFDINDVLLVVACCLFLVIGLISWDIHRHIPSDSMDSFTTLLFYFMYKGSSALGKLVYSSLLKNCEGIISQQENFLRNVLFKNMDTVYGKDYNFKDIKTSMEYRKHHPLTSYTHYLPYINQIQKGEKSVLTTSPCIGFSRTSGTSGNFKEIPLNKTTLDSLRTKYGAPLLFYALIAKGGNFNLNKTFHFRYKPKVTQSPCGLETAPLTYFLMKNITQIYGSYTVPQAVLQIESETTAFYIQAVFALKETDVGMITFNFVAHLNNFWQYVLQNADAIIEDIRNGSLKQELELEQELRDKILKFLKPNEKRADEVEREIKIGTIGLAKRLWKNLNHCKCMTMKSMLPQTEYLRRTIMKEVMFTTVYYGASEGLFGFDLSYKDSTDEFVLAYTAGFFEFILENDVDENQPLTLLAHQLEIGSQYELVVTNELGLCRYRTGDIVKVAGFKDQCPIITVEYRKGQMLNTRGEKMSELVFMEAVMTACDKLNVTLLDYATTDTGYLEHSRTGEVRNNYMLFLECDTKLSENDLNMFEECLRQKSKIYNFYREKKRILAMEVIQVSPGSFTSLKNLMTAGKSATQFKMPRVLTQTSHIHFLAEQKL